MKKLLIPFILILSVNLNAQSSIKDEVAIIQSNYGKSKTEILNQYLDLSAKDRAAFKSIYDSYEAKRKILGQKKIKIVYDYCENYATLTDEKTDQLSKENLKNNIDFEKLLSRTYIKAKKAIGIKNAAKFIELEIYFQTTIRLDIQDSIPFVHEIDDMKKG